MKRFKLNQTVNIINQDKVVNWLNMRGKTEIAEKVNNISYMIGRKGERYPEFVLAQSVKEIVDPKLFMEIECDIIQFMYKPKDLYYVGILSSDVKLSKKSLVK